MPQSPSPLRRRLADRLLQAFHAACDEGAAAIAQALLAVLEAHVAHPSYLPTGVERRAPMRFPGAHKRLRNLLRTQAAKDSNTAPPALSAQVRNVTGCAK